MYEVLKINLENKRLYLYVDRCLDLHLGVADKSDLIRHLSQNDHSCFQDLWRDTCDYLWEIGHRSVTFEEGMTWDKANEKYWADVFSPRERSERKAGH